MIGRMVLFGASGDLTSRLLMPAVAQLADAGLLPPGLTVLGSANTDWSTDDFDSTSPASWTSTRTDCSAVGWP
jgi:glucose-6-phosphate 1-dehydrogenase